MADPPWLRIARTFIGKEPNRPAVAARIGQIFPDLAAYCQQVNATDPWCGLFLAHCLSQMGYRPPFKPPGLQQGFMRSYAWSVWGLPSWRLPGDVVVLDRGGYHHCTFYVGDNGDGTWSCLGASQGPSFETRLWNYKASQCVAVRRPHPHSGSGAESLSTAKPSTDKMTPIPPSPPRPLEKTTSGNSIFDGRLITPNLPIT
jgi:hypothetical protein